MLYSSLKRIADCMKAASKDETRGYLCAVRLEHGIKTNEVWAVATDGFQLMRYKMFDEHLYVFLSTIQGEYPKTLLISSKSLDAIKILLKDKKCQHFELKQLDDKFLCVLGNVGTNVTLQLVNREYPNYNNLLDRTRNNFSVCLNIDLLKKSLEACGDGDFITLHFNTKNENHPVFFDLKGFDGKGPKVPTIHLGDGLIMPCKK